MDLLSGYLPFDTSFTLTAAATVLVFFIIYQQIKIFSFWSSRGIKGPTPWPLLGTNIYFILKDRTIVDEEWYKKYGHVYGTYEGHTPVLRVTDPELIKHVYIKNFSSFTDRNGRFIFGENTSRWQFWSKGDHWSTQRALVTPMFTSIKMKMFLNSMSTCIDRFLDEIGNRLQVSGHSNGGDEIAKTKAQLKACEKNVFSKDEVMGLTLDVIASSFFSIKLDTYRDKTSEFFKRAFAFSRFELSHFFFWLLLPVPIAKYFQIDITPRSKYEYFEKLSQSKIDERKKNPKLARNDFIQSLLDAKIPENNELSASVHTIEDDQEAHYNDQTKYQELERDYKDQTKRVIFRRFDDVEIRSQMTFFFLAGFETTSSALSFCFYELAHRQDIQDLLFEELKLNAPALDGSDAYATLLGLKTLDAFVSEILRLYCPVTEYNRIVTAKEGVILPTSPPIHLPFNTTVSTPAFVLQRREEYWPEPLKFDISRFYPENRDKIKSCTYMPFGLGPRNCVGMRFSLLENKLCLAKLLLKYRVLPGPNSCVYPPEFNRHAFFLQLKHSDFRLMPRE